MKKIGLIAGGVVVVLVLGVFIVLSTIDVNQYKGVIEEQAAAATGRTLKIEGDMDLSVSLSPAIVINGVRFQNADWGSRPDMAVIERIEASVPLLPLIFGNISVTRLALVSPDILLERNAQGQANWEFTTEETPADAEAEATALAISSIEIDDAKLAFKDAQGGTDLSAALERLRVAISGDLSAPDVNSLDLDSLTATLAGVDGAEPTEINVSSLQLEGTSGGTEIDLNSVIAGQAIGAEGKVGDISTLVAMQGDFPIKLALSLAGFDLETDLNATLGGERPSVTGSITAETIDLTTLPPAEEAPTPEKLFPADPLPTDAFNAADVDIDIAIDRLVLVQALAATNFKTNLKLENGTFSQSQTADLAGGALSSDVTLSSGSGALSINTKVDGVSAEQVAKDLNATDIITQGSIDFDTALNGSGNSIAAMMGSLDGYITGGMGEARIRNESINLAGADFLAQLMSALNPFADQEEFTVAECTVINLRVADGVAKSESGIAFVTDRMEITSSGNINFGEEKLDLNIRPKAKEGLGVGMSKLTQAVKITGPLSSPGIGLDAAGAAKTIGSIGLAFATGGASLLAEGAVERGASADDACEAARTWHLAGN